ncbi:hypothetical protein D1G28_12975, partial [Staphylococcus aureus]
MALIGQPDRHGPVAGGVHGRDAAAPQREHMAALDAVAGATVQGDDLVLAGVQAVAVDRHDLAGQRRVGGMRHVAVQRVLGGGGEAVADADFLLGQLDPQGRRHDLGLAIGGLAVLARPDQVGGAEVGGLVAEDLAGAWI